MTILPEWERQALLAKAATLVQAPKPPGVQRVKKKYGKKRAKKFRGFQLRYARA